MDILILSSLLLFGGLASFIKECEIRSAIRLAGIYIFITVVASLYTWIYYFAHLDADLLMAINVFLQVVNSSTQVLLGYLLAYIILNSQQLSHLTKSDGFINVIRSTRWAISISIANTFILATADKSQNMAYMFDFFRQSGYANWFRYFIMGAEALGALGILFHYKLTKGPLAAWGLLVIMAGAVYTHLHNHDPFPDSYAAVVRLICLTLLLLIYHFEKQAEKMHPVTPIYMV